jgi:PIN domain nuclease of toxin-antitoxin system
VILLDTHVWVWWVHGERLSASQLKELATNEETGLGVSVISCWEVAKLVERKRLTLPRPIDEWIKLALGYPGVQRLDLTPDIAIESSRLPGEFHRDPADQLLVATARVLEVPLATADQKILDYPHVETLCFAV